MKHLSLFNVKVVLTCAPWTRVKDF